MTTVLRVLLGRVIGAAVAGVATWLMTKFGIIVDADAQARVTESAIIILMVVFTAIYGVVHKLVNKRLNPGDTASAHLAENQKAQRERMHP